MQKQCVHLDVHRAFLHRPKTIRTALQGYLSPHNLIAMTCVHQQSKESPISGFGQVYCDPTHKLWHLISLSPKARHDGAVCSVWQEIVDHITWQASELGIEQIHAHPVVDSLEEEALAQQGYYRTYKEHLFQATRPLQNSSQPSDLYTFVLTGQWQLGELYRRSVPEFVRACCQTSCSPPISSTPLNRLAWQTFEWVAVQDETPYAYFCLTKHQTGQWLEILVEPEHSGDILRHIAYIASLNQPSRGKPLFCSIPDYAIGTAWLLRKLEFQQIQEHSHMIKQLAVKVCAPEPLGAQARTLLKYGDSASPVLSLEYKVSQVLETPRIDGKSEYAPGNN